MKYMALFSSLLCAQPAFAMRLIRFEIKGDGKTIMQGTCGDNGLQGSETVWSYRKNIRFRCVNGYRIVPAEGTPDQSTVQGKVTVFCFFGGSSNVEDLRLVRSKKKEWEWLLDPKDVERTERKDYPK